jgi:transketolase
LGQDEIKRIKEVYGFDPNLTFNVPSNVYEFYKFHSLARGVAAEKEWNEKFAQYKVSNPEKASELETRFSGHVDIEHIKSVIPHFDISQSKATRQFSGEVLGALVKALPQLVGGSADLTESTVLNKANLAGFSRTNRSGRYLHFGVREHAMAAISNGIAAYGSLLPFCATFANFIGYCWGALRLSALSHHKVLFVATHDSIDLGEDGPTHQPVEILSLLRACPGIQTIRPADGNETIGAYIAHLRDSNHGPTVLVLSRGAVPQLAGSSADHVLKGAYILSDFDAAPNTRRVILTGSGTEVCLLVQAKEKLADLGFNCRVVSFPSWDLFEAQSLEYKSSVFPNGIKTVHVEASNSLGAHKYASDVIGMTSFGASAPAKILKEKFGFTVDNIVKVASQH